RAFELAAERVRTRHPRTGQLERAYLDALAHIAKTGVLMRAPQQLQIVTEAGDTLTFTRRGQ
ncbi:META domain-containing protein, partial [Burkholderia multivorans]